MSAESHERCPTCRLVGMLRRVGAISAARRLGLGALRPVQGLAGGRGRGWLLARPAISAAARAVNGVLRPCSKHRGLGNALIPAMGIPLYGTLVDRTPASERPPSFGINLVGYLRAASGLGEAARLMSAALAASRLPHVLIDYHDGAPHPRSDASPAGFSRCNPYDHNLVHVNGGEAPVFAQAVGQRFFEHRRNIAFWHWEQLGLPVEWTAAFRWFDEIWTPTRFSAQAIGQDAPVPVRRVPLPVTAWSGELLGRERFGLPPDRFVFLFLFDYHSVFERKNPLAVVEAFQRAFADTDRALLVVKATHSDVDPENAARLARAVRHPGVRLIDESFTRTEVASLIAASDAFVSLHRSEGFGLGLAEAMLAGKPVIATDWSGNTDFMTPENSYPVRYQLTTLASDVGPYRRGAQWAEPDVEHAAELMRRVFERPEEVAVRAARARRDLEEGFSVAAVAEQLRALVRAPEAAALEAAAGEG